MPPFTCKYFEYPTYPHKHFSCHRQAGSSMDRGKGWVKFIFWHRKSSLQASSQSCWQAGNGRAEE